ncbi:MAG: prephenate dehydrogenase [Elusimicrobiota bacterium]|nr:prephenate dehydrogenase [Endomicrobiia bacterium]MCX7910570.1 prephenate dehydrogenase [Endomicrobiia bacterium]MDW8164890.1 prephenate dehydrogenase [Elusimicrobiota bacterium]
MNLKINNVTIIGVGLIGGSIGLALKEKTQIKITGYGRDIERLKLAKEFGCIDNYTTDLKHSVEYADLVIVATPVELIGDFIIKILPYLKDECIVIDVGSVKYEIIKKVSKEIKKYKKISFIGCHPIAGSEKTGFEFANKDLFRDSVCVVCYYEKLASKEAYNKVKTFWELLGAKVINIDAKKHDKILSKTSHFLHVISYLIVNHVGKNKEYLNFTAGAYRDMTRIAASNPNLWAQICMMNKDFLEKDIDDFIKKLKEIKKIINNKHRLYKIFLKAYKLKIGYGNKVV